MINKVEAAIGRASTAPVEGEGIVSNVTVDGDDLYERTRKLRELKSNRD